MRLKNKVAMITGGGAGIGAKIAERFVAEGARVCICDLHADALEKTATALPQGSCITCQGDVGKPGDVERMVQTTVDFGGRIDILINNAGMDDHADIVDSDSETWQRVMDTNINGPRLTLKAAIPGIKAAGGGAIVNIASLSAIRSLPEMPAYCSSKGALISLTQQVALDFGPSNIRCNAICPGPVKAGLLEAGVNRYAEASGTGVDKAFDQLTENVPLRRLAAPEDIAAACLFLSSEEASFITGATLVIDGGLSIVDPFSITMRDMPGLH